MGAGLARRDAEHGISGARRYAVVLVEGLKTSATAERIVRDLDYENEITEIYRNCGDYRLKVQILHKLEERAFGPPEKKQEAGKTPVDINVNIRCIGSTP